MPGLWVGNRRLAYAIGYAVHAEAGWSRTGRATVDSLWRSWTLHDDLVDSDRSVITAAC